MGEAVNPDDVFVIIEGMMHEAQYGGPLPDDFQDLQVRSDRLHPELPPTDARPDDRPPQPTTPAVVELTEDESISTRLSGPEPATSP